MWYHATTMVGYSNIIEQGVKFDVSWGSELDFGPGFYLAPDQKMAEDFILRQISFNRQNGLESIFPPEFFEAVVMEFEFHPFPYFERGELKVLDLNNEEFATFITDNRIRAKEGLIHDFPLIYGIMSDSNPAALVSMFRDGELDKHQVITGIMERTIGTRQLSIHVQELCDTLILRKAYEVAGRKELDINDYYNKR
ncbi:DUF3990 domain-containing protein [Exiguobacterium sp. AM39-5BH]|uniref:DUF3990 domain-containing protein n=1 Tax=Exiguobacterium sp. AM39-5BH TaxID=2292355 RepID=UPI001314FB1C|nr:DUF3990 domain-containing protein [Exiguobacterium sp. AM39-5BH]